MSDLVKNSKKAAPAVSAGELLTEILAWCDQHRCSRTRFGRETMGSSNFVARLEQGARPTAHTVSKCYAYMHSDAPAYIPIRPSRAGRERDAPCRPGEWSDPDWAKRKRASAMLLAAIRREHHDHVAG